MLRLLSSNYWSKYCTKSSISLVQTLNISTQHDAQGTLPSNISTTTDVPPPAADPDSPFIPDFDAIPAIRHEGKNPSSPSPSPTAPRTDSPEFSDPPNTSPPGREAPQPPTSPPGQPEAFPPGAPGKPPPDPKEQIRTSNVRSE
ncbi:hypothetical protein HAX54_039084 [Datura stramonium]|uniref:Uncharacterized protein n=1 Tax=Datura stramonium TaxID=4076 RepID=A0ABS8VMF4_DATST|nr:hypothetical protein [Datura stramonium]